VARRDLYLTNFTFSFTSFLLKMSTYIACITSIITNCYFSSTIPSQYSNLYTFNLSHTTYPSALHITTLSTHSRNTPIWNRTPSSIYWLALFIRILEVLYSKLGPEVSYAYRIFVVPPDVPGKCWRNYSTPFAYHITKPPSECQLHNLCCG